MTENEAKGFIQGKLDCMNKCDVFDCKGTDECDGCNYCYSQGNFVEQKKAFKMAIQALEGIQQYRAIGTIEECRTAVERMKPKKIEIQRWIYTKCECGYEFSKHHGDGYYSVPYDKQTDYCPKCGQHLDWSE